MCCIWVLVLRVRLQQFEVLWVCCVWVLVLWVCLQQFESAISEKAWQLAADVRTVSAPE